MYVALRVVNNGEDSPAFLEVLRTGQKFGLRLERVRTAANDARPRPWYSAAVGDAGVAKQFLAAVQNSPALDAAYLKPADSVP
jgi:hypothetical protein